MTQNLDSFLGAYADDFAYSFDNAIILNWYPRRLIAHHPASSKVLELGIGHGYTCNQFGAHFDQYEVIDGSPAVIDQFKSKYPDANVKLHHGYFEEIDVTDKYDLIVMGFVLEHVADPGQILRRYRAFLNPGGRIAVSVPNAESLHRRIGHAAGLLPDMMALGPGDHALGHLRSFSLNSLKELLVQSGYRITSTEGIFLKPLMTSQMKSLDLAPEIIEGLCKVGTDYPELSAALLIEAEAA